jgi:2,3-bisphosphoglycerate-dependent phosphoglycerate mutase
MTFLLLVRHGESEWNALAKIAGLTDISLSQHGTEQAAILGTKLQHYKIDIAFTSQLQRAIQTLDSINLQLSQPIITRRETAILNERDYGSLSARYKVDVLEELGQAKYDDIFKGWSTPAPNGESLMDVCKRTAAFYDSTVLPALQADKTVLIVSHHHTLRALIKHIEGLSAGQVGELRLKNTQLVAYEYEKNTGHLVKVRPPFTD